MKGEPQILLQKRELNIKFEVVVNTMLVCEFSYVDAGLHGQLNEIDYSMGFVE